MESFLCSSHSVVLSTWYVKYKWMCAHDQGYTVDTNALSGKVKS